MKKTLLFLVSVVLLGGCKEDFDLTGPYEETTVVYGLLNSADTVQFIRIQKGFLSDGNAYQVAGIADSIYYPDVLEVKLKTLGGGQEYALQRVDGRDYGLYKTGGTFINEPNILYKLSGKLDSLKAYQLTVKNTGNGHEVTAETRLVNNFTLAYPSPGVRFPMAIDGPIQLNWSNAANAGTYDIVVRFNYREYDRLTNTLLADTFTDVILKSNYIPANPNAGEITEFSFESEDFYYPLSEQIGQNPGVDREFNASKGMEFIFTIGGDQLSRYINSRNAQTGLVQNEAVPVYTNVTGGVGILSSKLPVRVKGVMLDARSLDSLKLGRYTSVLRFR